MKQHQRITAALTSGRSSAEKMVLLTLASHANHDGSAWPSIATMVDESSLSRATVMRSLLSLESDGLLERTRTGRRTTYDVQWTGLMVRPLKSHGGTSDVSPSCARLEPIQEPIQGTDSSSSQTRAIPQPPEEEGTHNHGGVSSGADNPTPGAVVASGFTSRSTESVRSTAVDPSKRAGARSQAGNRRYATTTEAASPGVTGAHGAQTAAASAEPTKRVWAAGAGRHDLIEQSTKQVPTPAGSDIPAPITTREATNERRAAEPVPDPALLRVRPSAREAAGGVQTVLRTGGHGGVEQQPGPATGDRDERRAPQAARGEGRSRSGGDLATPATPASPAPAPLPPHYPRPTPPPQPQPAHRTVSDSEILPQISSGPVTIPRGQLRRPPVAGDGVIEIETRSTTEDQRAALRAAGLRFDGKMWVGPDTPATRAAVERLCPWSAQSEVAQVALPLDGRGAVVEMRREPTRQQMIEQAQREEYLRDWAWIEDEQGQEAQV